MNYFTTKQAANLLGVNDESYVRKLVLSGKLEANKVGTQWMIGEEAIHKFKVKNDIRSKYKALLSFNQELRTLADKILDKNQKMVGPRDMFTAFAIGKGYKTHGAILLLCKQGYGEDASILARSLYDLLINLLYIQADQTDGRAYRYFQYDWILRKKMFTYVLEKPEIMDKILERTNNPRPDDTTIKEVEEQAKLSQEKNNYTERGWSDKSLHDMSKEVGRIDAYKTVYRLQCQLDHNATRSVNEYAKHTQGGIVFEVGQSENWVEESLVIAFDFYYSILVAFNSQFKSGFDKEILDLENRYITELSEINKKS
ncbi:MAG: DUF5677 domain-containing protein [Patescibacteria group bacterium]|jgi:excisionase family DNA binding protein